MKNKYVTARVAVRVRLSVLLEEALCLAMTSATCRAFKHRDQPIATQADLMNALGENLRIAFWNALAELGVEVE